MERAVLLASLLAAVRAQTLDDVTGALDKCSRAPDWYSCLKVRVVALLDTALAVDQWSMAKDSAAKDFLLRVKQDLDARDLEDKNSTLGMTLLDRLGKLMTTNNLQINKADGVFEARGKVLKGNKKGGKGLILLVFGAFGALLLKVGLAVVALLAAKALMVGKMALLLAGILGLKSLLARDGEKSAPQGEIKEQNAPEIIMARLRHLLVEKAFYSEKEFMTSRWEEIQN